MDLDFVKIATAIFLACSGWLIVNHLTTKREINAKKRELVTKYQVETFTAINTFFTYLLIHENPPAEVRTNFNNAISMIQLLGSQSQIEKFSSILEKMMEISATQSSKLKGSEIDTLLQDVRNELRNELQLEQVNNKVISMLSFDKNNK